MSFTDTMEKKKSTFVWTKIPYFGIDSEEAEEERRLLLAGDDDQQEVLKRLPGLYLSGKREWNRNETSGLPIGVVSLEQIKKLPLHKQVTSIAFF